MGIREDWDRIEAWAKENFPEGEFRLAKGATKKKIDELEQHIGVLLPEDMRESWRIHDGSEKTSFAYIGDLMNLEEIRRYWDIHNDGQAKTGWGLAGEELMQQNPKRKVKSAYWDPSGMGGQPSRISNSAGPVKPALWLRGRILVTDSGSGDGLMIDTDPAKGGTRGQVIHYDHEVGPIWVYTASWSELLKQLADDAEAGKYVYDPDSYTIWGRMGSRKDR